MTADVVVNDAAGVQLQTRFIDPKTFTVESSSIPRDRPSSAVAKTGAQHYKPPQYPEWMDLKTLQSYACVSERKVRDWIHRPQHPLPVVQVERGKFLVKRSQFDRWLEAHSYRPDEAQDLGRLVDEVMNDLKGLN